MGIENYPALIGLFLRMIGAILVVAYVIPKQIMEVRRPKNNFTPLRIRLLLLAILVVITVIPSIARSYQVIHRESPNMIASIASISTNLAYLTFAVLLASIYRYKDK